MHVGNTVQEMSLCVVFCCSPPFVFFFLVFFFFLVRLFLLRMISGFFLLGCAYCF